MDSDMTGFATRQPYYACVAIAVASYIQLSYKN